MLQELRGYKTQSIIVAEKARELTLEMAPDHEEYRTDGDLVADLRELSERVWDQSEVDYEYEPSVDLGIFEGARHYYIGDRYGIEIDLFYLVAACAEAGIETPYQGGFDPGY